MDAFLFRTAIRPLVAAAVLAAAGAVSVTTAQAANALVTVDDATSYEGIVVCEDDFPDPCGTVVALPLRFYVRASNRPPNTAITVGWRLVPGTATAGNDYTGPTTGSVTIAASELATELTVPLVFDGFNEPTEQFTVELTSSSIPATIRDTGIGTILDGTQIPQDCSVSLPDRGVMALDCTGRPPTQQWRLQAYCWPFGWRQTRYGNVVTGNGRSVVDCARAPASDPYFRLA